MAKKQNGDIPSDMHVHGLESGFNDLYMALCGENNPDSGRDVASGLFAIAEALREVAGAIRKSNEEEEW